MSRVTDHTRTEKIGGDSINFMVTHVVAGNRYDSDNLLIKYFKCELYFIYILNW